jgi:hypothetical protein
MGCCDISLLYLVYRLVTLTLIPSILVSSVVIGMLDMIQLFVISGNE